MSAKIVLVHLIFAAVSAAEFYDFDDDFMHDSGHSKYAFEYGVRDSFSQDHKNQWEVRDGDVVKGSYRFLQPDGRMRIVNYYADGQNGFRADVKYEESEKRSNEETRNRMAKYRGIIHPRIPGDDDFNWDFRFPVRRALSQPDYEPDYGKISDGELSLASRDSVLESGDDGGPELGLGPDLGCESNGYQVQEIPE